MVIKLLQLWSLHFASSLGCSSGFELNSIRTHVMLSVPMPSLCGSFASSATISSMISSTTFCLGSSALRVYIASRTQVDASAEVKQSHRPSHAKTRKESADFRFRTVISGTQVIHCLSTDKFLFCL